MEIRDRNIVHLDLDTFFVSLERLRDSSLNGKPIIIGGLSDRGVVASCSYEARQYGVHSAMPMATEMPISASLDCFGPGWMAQSCMGGSLIRPRAF